MCYYIFDCINVDLIIWFMPIQNVIEECMIGSAIIFLPLERVSAKPIHLLQLLIIFFLVYVILSLHFSSYFTLCESFNTNITQTTT